MWIKNFYNELKTWIIVWWVCHTHREYLDLVGLKMAWFGRLYKVINRDPEIELGSEEDATYLKNELAKIRAILVELRLIDILAYELRPLDSVNLIEDGKEEFEHGYLIVFTPAYNLNRQYVTLKSLSFVLLALIALIFFIAMIISNIQW